MHLLLLAADGTGSLVEAFKHNPTFMVLNLCCSAIVLTIVVERFAFQLTRYRVNSKEFFAQIKKLVAAGNIDRHCFIHVGYANQGCVGQVGVHSGVIAAH